MIPMPRFTYSWCKEVCTCTQRANAVVAVFLREVPVRLLRFFLLVSILLFLPGCLLVAVPCRCLVHFSGRPQTADTSEYLVQDIARELGPEVQIGRVYVVPFGDCQREISIACPNALRVIMYRRIMYSVAERIAQIEGAKAIVTGESLGQVASQTLENIMAVNEVVDIPVFRPLIGSDKQEIIERAPIHRYV